MRPSRETAGAVRADGVIAARPAWQRRSDSELSAALARVDRHGDCARGASECRIVEAAPGNSRWDHAGSIIVRPTVGVAGDKLE